MPEGQEDKLTRAELARAHGVDPRTVDRWVKRGLPYEGASKKKLFDPATVFEWRLSRELDAIEPNEKIDTLDEARMRKTAAEAELAELTLARARGELAPVALMVELVSGMNSTTRTKLEGLPAKVSRVLESMTATEIEIRLEEEVREALESLVSDDPFADLVVERDREAQARR